MRNLRLLMVIVLLGTSLSMAGQEDQSWTVPRTEHGYPDLQGNWSNPFQTPLERPINLGLQRVYTDEQAQALGRQP